MRRGLVVAWWAVFAALPAWSAFDDAPFGARDAGLGGAFAAVHDDLGAIAYNPAALGHIPAPEATASYLNGLHYPAGSIDRDTTRAAVGIPVRQDIFNGAFGFDVRYDRRAGSDRDRQIGIFYGTRGLRETEEGGLDFGAGLKTLQVQPEGGSGKTKAVLDLGALWRFGAGRAFGASLLNFGGASFKSGAFSDRAPLALKLGMAESVHGSLIAVDATVREPSAGQGRSVSFAAGFERWRQTERAGAFAGRAGLSLGNLSRTGYCGAGWMRGGVRADYALSMPLSGVARFGHALTLSLRFGRSDPQAEYEQLLQGEMKARRDLGHALDASADRQVQLSEQIKRLREEIASLRSSLAQKRASEEEARRRLQELENRYHHAAETYKNLQDEQARNAARTRAELYREEWASYQKAKLGGAPDAALQERVQRLLVEYKDAGVDLGEANQELRRLQQSR